MGIGSISRRAVFLDRDGVLCEAIVKDGLPYPPKDLSELVVCEGAEESLAQLHDAGFLLIVVSNQPDVARGVQSIDLVEQINGALSAKLPLDAVYVCYHDSPSNCDCRKPRPGMVREAADRFGIDLTASFMVGDRWRDIDAGVAAGCKTILIDRKYAERPPSHSPDARVENIAQAARWILEAQSLP